MSGKSLRIVVLNSVSIMLIDICLQAQFESFHSQFVLRLHLTAPYRRITTVCNDCGGLFCELRARWPIANDVDAFHSSINVKGFGSPRTCVVIGNSSEGGPEINGNN